MTLQGVTYQGPKLETPARLEGLPDDLFEILWQVNGFVAYAGGLHVRGMVDQPEWHSLEHYWTGEMALHKLFSGIEETDLPFGQDFLGNQFFLRGDDVWKLRGDTGEIRSMGVDLPHFLEAARQDPIEFLELHLLAKFSEAVGMLEPGRLVHTIPPLCMSREQNKLALKPAPIDGTIAFLAHFARQIEDVPEGMEVNLKLFTPETGPETIQ